MPMDNADESLTNTLVLALTQCQQQVREINNYVQTISRLQFENKRLSRELQDAQLLSENNVVETRLKAQIEQLCQKDIERQMQNDDLRMKLRKYKILARKYGFSDPQTSSPISSSVGLDVSSPRNIHAVSDAPEIKSVLSTSVRLENRSTTGADRSFSTLHKRPRSASPIDKPPLNEAHHNTPAVTSSKESEASLKKSRRSTRGVEAIPSIAEDGESYVTDNQEEKLHQVDIPHNSLHRRLGELMTNPVPPRPLLLPQYASPDVSKNNSKDDEQQAVDMQPSVSPTRASPQVTSSVSVGQSSRQSKKTSRQQATGIIVEKMSTIKGPEDDEPFRSRPLLRLDLSHFKLNPNVNAGLDYAFNEVVRGRHERKCLPGCTRPDCCGNTFAILAKTLVHMPGEKNVSDDEILMAYLGTGSGEKIKSLTPMARQNLLHDAKTKLIADTYGKQHRDLHERQKSPPGFWVTDMPGSQEHRTYLSQARSRDRDEVARRHQEALKENGRWIFADE